MCVQCSYGRSNKYEKRHCFSKGVCPGQLVQPEQQVLSLNKQDLPECNPQLMPHSQQYPKDQKFPSQSWSVERAVVENRASTLCFEETVPETLGTKMVKDRMRSIGEESGLNELKKLPGPTADTRPSRVSFP